VKYETDQFTSSQIEKKLDPVDSMLIAIKSLPAAQQEILRLFYLEKTPIKLLAELMDKPVGTIKSRLYHARELLKKKLNNTNHG